MIGILMTQIYPAIHVKLREQFKRLAVRGQRPSQLSLLRRNSLASRGLCAVTRSVVGRCSLMESGWPVSGATGSAADGGDLGPDLSDVAG